MTLEEAILYHAAEVETLKQHKKVNEIFLGTEGYKKALQEHTQLAEWLGELKERRKQPEIIRCGECKFANKPDDDMSAIIESYGDEVYCSNHDIYLYKGWYCGDGKRRTDATD